MEAVGFVLLVIGLGVTFLAKRIVMSKVKLDEADGKEMELLAGGGIIAVRIAGFIVGLVGLMFLMM